MFGRLYPRLLAVLLSAGLLLAACTQPQQNAPVPATGGFSQAPVQSVEVAQVFGSSSQLRALVKGSLPDSCTRLVDPVIQPGGNLVVVILPAVRDGSVRNCSTSPVPFERIIPLGQRFAPGNYTVSVNGVTAAFALPGSPVVQAAEPTLAAPTASAVAATLPVGGSAPTAQATRIAAAQATPTPQAEPTLAAPTAAPTLEPTQIAAEGSAKAVPVTASGQPAGCENKMAFVRDMTVDDDTLFSAGDAFTKTWRVQNAGTCAWSGYSLVFMGGDPMGSASRVSMSGTVAPGTMVDISVKLTAPAAPGSYITNWFLLAPDGTKFGVGNPPVGPLYAKIGVRSPVVVPTSTTACPTLTNPSIEAQILQLLNVERAKASLPPLTLNAQLSAAARLHSQDNSCYDRVIHPGSDGSLWPARIAAQGVKYKNSSEIIYGGPAWNGNFASNPVIWWMNDYPHKVIILDPNLTTVGIGYVHNDQSTIKDFYTVDFIKP